MLYQSPSLTPLSSPAPHPCLEVMPLSGYLLLDLFIATIPCVCLFFTLFFYVLKNCTVILLNKKKSQKLVVMPHV